MPAQPKLAISVQQTRFESSALVAPTTGEVLIKDLCITIEPNKEVFSHADLHLKEHGHYVLVGRNGTGKSTLLYSIANGLIPGISWRLKILLLGQTRELGLGEAIGGLSIAQGETVLEHVLRSDNVREIYLREATMLSSALDDVNNTSAPVRAVRQIEHRRLLKELEETKRLAERRSGARGKNARKDLIAMEEKVALSEKCLSDNLNDLNAETLSQETQNAADLLSGIQAQLEMMDASAADATARKVLLGLGFSPEQIIGPVSNLSGGWRTRCELACALSQRPDILLLDEPTNFLDLPSIIWLQSYLETLTRTTILCVTHDRDFIDNISEDLIILRDQKLEYFHGSLSLYEAEKWKKIKYLTKMKEAQEKQKKHMEQSISNNIKDAKKHGDDKKLKQAVSRQKKVDDRLGMQKSATGGRWKLNRDLVQQAGYYHTSRRAAIDIPDFEPPVKLVFPSLPGELRFPGALVSMENISFAYTRKAGAKQILDNVSLTIHTGERVGLVGLNGSGKSTLVHVLMGEDEDGRAALLSKGAVTRHPRARIARFSQQSVEQLQQYASRNPQATALSHLMDIAGTSFTEKEARSVLGGLGLQGQIASHVPIAALSGGQKVRLAFAKLIYNPPHLFVLDEVTTHLDSDTIQALIRELKRYDGALLVVTHDRFFMRCVVEGESPTATAVEGNDGDLDADDLDSSDEDADERSPGVVYRMRKGQLVKLEGGMLEYEGIAERAAIRLKKAGEAG